MAFKAEAPNFDFLAQSGQQIGNIIDQHQENIRRIKQMQIDDNLGSQGYQKLIDDASQQYLDATGTTDKTKAALIAHRYFLPKPPGGDWKDAFTSWSKNSSEWDKMLEGLKGEAKAAKKQKATQGVAQEALQSNISGKPITSAQYALKQTAAGGEDKTGVEALGKMETLQNKSDIEKQRDARIQAEGEKNRQSRERIDRGARKYKDNVAAMIHVNAALKYDKMLGDEEKNFEKLQQTDEENKIKVTYDKPYIPVVNEEVVARHEKEMQRLRDEMDGQMEKAEQTGEAPRQHGLTPAPTKSKYEVKVH